MKVQTLVLAAGKSSRMWPLGDKVLFKYFGKSLLQHQLESLQAAGLEDFTIVCNKGNFSMIEKICQENFANLIFKLAVQSDFAKGLAGGVLAGENFLKMDQPLLVVNSNDFVEKECFTNLLEQRKKSKAEILIVGKVVENYFPGGYLQVSQENQIEKIVEKPDPQKVPSNLVALLIQLFEKPKKLFKKIRESESDRDDVFECALQQLFNEKIPAQVCPHQGFWQALKFPWDHLKLAEFFLGKLNKTFVHPSATVASSAILNGPVFVSENCKILAGAILNGPVFLGENCVVGNHALLRDCHLGRNCVAGAHTEICRSFVGEGCIFHRNYLGDSILQENVSFGANACTANFRLDGQEIFTKVKGEKTGTKRKKFGAVIGKNVRIGVGTHLMPGVKVGQDSFIASGICVEKDLAEKKFLKAEMKTIEKENKFSKQNP